MSIPEYRYLDNSARQHLEHAPMQRTIILFYTLASIAMAITITVSQYVLSVQISKTGGLGNLGLRSMLSSLSQFLPVVQLGLSIALNFGYMAAMTRISRGLYTSVNSMRAGIDRFWPLLRCSVLKMLIFMGATFISFYAAMAVFLISPLSNRLVDLLTPYINDVSMLNPGEISIDAVLQEEIIGATVPALILFAVALAVFALPMFYRYRFSNRILYDNPGKGALFVLQESKRMMQGNKIPLLRLDLHFWWYYLLLTLVSVIAYGDVLLQMLGVPMPFTDDFGYFLFYFISLAIQFVIFYLFRNRVETVYACAYNALRPKPQSDGVVLGNIFQM